MLKITKILTPIATLLLSLTAIQSAKADIPMSVFEGNSNRDWILGSPADDTTRPAYGGRLRLYDVHIAKMVEVTQYECDRAPKTQVLTWEYNAGGTFMGRFRISCDLANDLTIAYGQGYRESTSFYALDNNQPTTLNLPTLNIRGGKIDKWLNFTANFKPRR
jgi:hypothetical protein